MPADRVGQEVVAVWAFGICVADEGKLERHAMAGIRRVADESTWLLTSRDNESIFPAYNEMLDALAGQDDLEGAVLLHEDVELLDGAGLSAIGAALAEPDVAVVGVVGARDVTSLAWWEGRTFGSCRETRGELRFRPAPADVDSVDGLLLALSPWAVRNLRFDDATYRGFHGYDADLCFQARAAGKRVVVADVAVEHHTKGGYGDVDSYRRADEAFRRKWVAPPPGRVCLELGGGTKARPGWANLDPAHGTGEWRRPAQALPWPAADGAVDAIFASHVMEHIPAGADRITVMNEAWRVLRPGGTFEIRVPLFGTWEAVADPTHVSWWVPQSFAYFTGELAPDADYGIRRWEAASVEVVDGWELRGVLRKPVAG